jgi:Protein of unknown function (DUF2778)
MTFSSALGSVSDGFDHGRQSGHAIPQKALGGAALACIVLACASVLWGNLAGSATNQTATDEPSAPRDARLDARPPSLANAYARLAAALHGYAQRLPAANDYAAFFDPHYLLGFAPGTFSTSAALQAGESRVAAGVGRFTTHVAAEISSTLKRTDRLVANVATAALQPQPPRTQGAALRDRGETTRAAANAAAEKPTIFEKLFGKPASALTLAYAAPEDGGLGDGGSAAGGRYDRWTAVYDISAHTVYLPDGTALEAHSGRGSLLDDPAHVDEKNRGATPPDIYDLELREGLFHGVQALRLIPVDERKVFGRSGLLAHTYMLGPNGDSFGCVSFRNYNSFLQAYLNHKIKRLVVVAGPV